MRNREITLRKNGLALWTEFLWYIFTALDGEMGELVETTVGTKFTSRFSSMMVKLALDAVKTVAVTDDGGRLEIDIKRFAKVEKIPGGEIDDCRVLSGVMFNKDISHAKMRRKIENPRIILLDCPLEYKKFESEANVECSNEDDWELLLRQEEDWIKATVDKILVYKPDLVITEKGLSDLAQHFFVRAGVTALRRLRKCHKPLDPTLPSPPGPKKYSHLSRFPIK
eukprot:COSAG05_NODE_7616_length_789_cov_2.005797_1_plen_224_part_10